MDDGTLGICQRSSGSDLEVIGYFPREERLRKNNFLEEHSKIWDSKENKSDFKNKMRDKFPELNDFLTEGKESNKSEWTNAYDRFIEERPRDIEFIELPGPPPQGTY